MKPLHPANSGAPLGPYSPAMDCGGIIFFSGQIAMTPDGGFANASLDQELDQVFANIDALLEAGEVTKSQIPKVTVYLSDMNDFAEMNKKYIEYFNGHKPARTTIEVAKLPLDARVEIEVMVKR